MNRCTCRAVIVDGLAATLDCPEPMLPVPGGRWAHLIGVPARLWAPQPRAAWDTAAPDIGPGYEWYRELADA